MIVIKRNEKFIYKLLLFHHLPVLFCLFTIKISVWIVITVWILFIPILVFCRSIFVKELKSVIFNNDSVVFNFITEFKTKSKCYSLDEIIFSYKHEVVGRGIKGLEFRIYSINNDKLFQIGNDIDGWDKNRINKIITEIEKRNIKIIYK